MDQKDKVEIEELLKLKKFEKPDEEFWDQFDQGLRKKSMEALVNDKAGGFSSFWDRKWTQQVALASAFVFCAVPTYLGVQNFYSETQASEASFQMANAEVSRVHQEMRAAETTRELALKKSKADNMRFVSDTYQIDPSTYELSDEVWKQPQVWKASNRTYVDDRVKLMPESADVLPVNLRY